jgi:molybdate transport system substrate-binding protein
MRRPIGFIAVLLLSLTVLTMGGNRVALAEEELIVSGAASLTNVFGEIGKRFESASPGTKVVFNFAASGPLLQQIEKGAPVDVFASADQKTMDQAMEKKLILTDTRRNFASNRLVLITPGDSKVTVGSLRDLGLEKVARVSLGNPETVPAGRYAQELLSNEGLWEILKPKFIYGNSVRQVLDYVVRGEVDAGFVFATDAAMAKDKARVALTAEKHKPISYPIAVVATTHAKETAQRFIDYVLSPEGREVLSRYGFGGD